VTIVSKRRLVVQALFGAAVATTYGCSLQKPKSIEVDVSGVDSVPKLIAAIKKAGGRWLPDSMPDTPFVHEFAQAFVANAHAAAQLGYAIPRWVLDKVPTRKVVFPALGLMIIPFAGIEFVIPVATVIVAVLGSILIMTAAIVSAIAEVKKPGSKA
jgi:hypothetical protein